MALSTPSSLASTPVSFRGFEPLDANYIYCPNQLFDVCLPNVSRGTFRVVAYLLRRTLGWLDKNGEPIEQNIKVSYTELIERARISRGALRDALDAAICGNYIHCVKKGNAHSRDQAASSAEYALRWSRGVAYTVDPNRFDGFFTGEGHRTPVPNSYFDVVVPGEPLAVTKVVGTVLRHTIGYQNQFGGRRSQRELSYTFIQEFAKIGGRTNLASAIQGALTSNYIERIDAGCAHASKAHRRPATYAIRWLCHAQNTEIGSKTVLANSDRFKNSTSNGSESGPANRFKNSTNEKTDTKNTDKQQRDASVVAVNSSSGYELLREVGFDVAIAHRLAETTCLADIQQQIEWLPLRNAQTNLLGMLRRAIEEGWDKPTAAIAVSPTAPRRSDEIDATETAKQERAARRKELLIAWERLSIDDRRALIEQATHAATSELVRTRLRRLRDAPSQPPNEVLALIPSPSQP